MAASLALQAVPRLASVAIMSDVERIEPTDGQLILRTAGGDRSAFEELHARYRRAVLGLALRRIGDRGRAEDATQDAFVAVWRSARTYDPARGNGTTWLYAVATQRDHGSPPANARACRRARRQPVRRAGPPDEAEASWTAWRVHRALEVLPEHERPVIELAYWGGLSQSEIAERLELPLGTVKTRTRSALARLADELDGELR